MWDVDIFNETQMVYYVNLFSVFLLFACNLL